MNIVEFLEARIDDDEEQASSGWERLGDSRWERDNYGRTLLTPSAVLAECKAKRTIIELHEAFGSGDERGAEAMWIATRGILEVLAAVYADHPDYNPEWRHA